MTVSKIGRHFAINVLTLQHVCFLSCTCKGVVSHSQWGPGSPLSALQMTEAGIMSHQLDREMDQLQL